MNDSTLWLMWQLADSAFPAGGLAHSGGLEAAWRQGSVTNPEELVGFIEAALRQAGHAYVPLVVAAQRTPEQLHELDRRCDAFLTNHVVNRASRAQGQGWLSAAANVFALPPIVALRQRVLERHQPGHLAPVFGVIAGALGLSDIEAARVFVFVTLRGLVSSAVRLGIVGPIQGQAIQTTLSPLAEQIAQEGLLRDPQTLAQVSPIQDILAGGHDRLYSRLFQT